MVCSLGQSAVFCNKRNFIYLASDSFVVLYKSMIRSHLEYAVSVWNPHHQSLKLEKVQKRATKLVLTVKKLCYEERLQKVKLPTLKYRRIRGDMIELYKIFAGKYESEITEWIMGKFIERQYDTRNHRFALQQSHIHYGMVYVNLVFLTELSRYGIDYQIT